MQLLKGEEGIHVERKDAVGCLEFAYDQSERVDDQLGVPLRHVWAEEFEDVNFHAHQFKAFAHLRNQHGHYLSVHLEQVAGIQPDQLQRERQLVAEERGAESLADELVDDLLSFFLGFEDFDEREDDVGKMGIEQQLEAFLKVHNVQEFDD